MSLLSVLRGVRDQLIDHAEFEELCVLSGTNGLTDEERVRLDKHLADCVACREFLEQFQQNTQATMAALAPEFAPETSTATAVWDAEAAKRRLFQNLPAFDGPNQRDRELPEFVVSRSRSCARNPIAESLPLSILRVVRPYFPYAAGFVVATGLSLALYWHGPRQMDEAFRTQADRAEGEAAGLRERLEGVTSERDRLIVDLNRRTADVDALRKEAQDQQQKLVLLQASNLATEQEKQQLAAAQDRLNSNLQQAQASLAATRNELESAHRQDADDVAGLADLQRRVDEQAALIKEQSAVVKEQENAIQQQRDLLASDRDIRDLIGARQLYVAEVYDAELNGKPRKPFARVFFTKDKSLIFYGYDLDKEPGVKNADAFQVWGQRGSDREQALNLGILYQDASANRRWVLKIDNPKTLQQIDAVFVTIEPKGGSTEPTGKPLLFAYLRIDPNHP